MQQLSGAEMVVQSLIDLKVSHLFGYPGGSVLDIYDALFAQTEMKHVLVRHEQAAVHMADGFARSTGEVGAVLVTSGPGATNCLTGIATAYMDSVPLVVISGQVPTAVIGEDAFQETDMVGCSRPIVKHSYLCKRAQDIPAMLAKAFHIAATGRPGPVVVDLPKDILNPKNKYLYQLPEKVDLRSYQPKYQGHPKQIRKAVDLIQSAKKPIIYYGGGVVIAEAGQQLTEFAERLNLPVTSTLMGLGAVDGNHSQFLGMLGMHGRYEANCAMHNADLILAFGARFDDRVTNNVEKFCPNAKIVHVDIDPTSISKTIHAHVPIVGSVSNVLTQLNAELDARSITVDTESRALWWKDVDDWRAQRCLEYTKTEGVIKPQTVIEALHKVTNGDAYVTSDVGQHQMFAALYYPFKRSRQWLNSGGLGTMGYGLPAAMGAQFAFPDADVACVTGDGSIQMNIQELATCLQYNVPVKIISLNNRSLGMVRQWQDMIYGGRHAHSYMDSLPDFVKLAEAYGHVGIRIDKEEDLESGLAEAFALKDRVVFVDINVDPKEHVYPMQIKFGAMDAMYLSKTEKANA